MNDSHWKLLQAGPMIHCDFDQRGLENEADDSEAGYEGEQQLDAQERAERNDEAIRDLMRALHDGDYWIMKTGLPLPLKEIPPRHARNIIGWLRKRAMFLHDLAVLEFMEGTPPMGEQALAGFDAAFDQLNDMDPVVWVMQTPLVLNLKEKVQRHEARHGR